jgi:hypothetical protein
MVDRSLYFFMDPGEKEQVVAELRDRGADVFFEDPRLVLVDHDKRPNAPAWFAYVGWPDLSDGTPDDVVANPGAHAWVRFWLPRQEGQRLYQAGLDIRTRWLDHDNVDGLEEFKRAARVVRPLLRRPAWVWSVRHERVAHPKVRTIGFTHEAEELFARGIEWMQIGVEFTRCGPRPPTDDAT